MKVTDLNTIGISFEKLNCLSGIRRCAFVMALLFVMHLTHTAWSAVVNYQYSAPITLPETSQPEELAQVLLTPEIFRVTRDDLSDLRIVRRDNQHPIPFLVECVTHEQEEVRRAPDKPWTMTTQLPVQDGQPLSFVFERSRERGMLPMTMGLNIDTPLTQFEQDVKVEASEDGKNWKTVVSQVRIFDYSPFANVRVTEIPVASGIREQYLRLTFAHAYVQRLSQSTQVRTTTTVATPEQVERTYTEEKIPFRLNGIKGWTAEKHWVRDVRPIVSRDIEIVDTPPPTFAKRFPERHALVFAAHRMPLEYLQLDSTARIITVGYELYAERSYADGSGEPWWERIKTGTLERTMFRDYRYENMTIAWSPPTRASRYALVFYKDANTDAKTISIKEAKGPDYRIVFPYNQGEQVELWAGLPLATRSSLGYYPEQIQMLRRTVTTPVTGTLGDLITYVDYTPKVKTSVNTTLLLSIAIILAVAALGFTVFKAMQRMPEEVEN